MSLIVGLGSPHGDDQLGWVVVDRLRPGWPAGITVAKVDGGIGLLASLVGHEAAVVIDAAAPAGRPGTIRSYIWPSAEIGPLHTVEHARIRACRSASVGRDPRPFAKAREHLYH